VNLLPPDHRQRKQGSMRPQPVPEATRLHATSSLRPHNPPSYASLACGGRFAYFVRLVKRDQTQRSSLKHRTERPPDGSSPNGGSDPSEEGSEKAENRNKEWLADRHFTQQSQRPPALAPVAVESLHPLLRSLLFTDGTVTRALEVHALAPTNVEVRREAVEVAPRMAAQCLHIPFGTHAIQRRVAITVDRSPDFVLWAESHLLPARLPSAFFDSLESNLGGIGVSLQTTRLEGWRELLWFGLSCQPEWSLEGALPATSVSVLKRLYRVFTNGQPALLIAESFPVEYVHGEYRLFGHSSV
jgi:chorismate-pyruvate lyase